MMIVVFLSTLAARGLEEPKTGGNGIFKNR
jgi:hypothetical protein